MTPPSPCRRKRHRQMKKKRADLLKHAQHMHDNINNPIYEPVPHEDTSYPINDGQLIIATEEELERGEILGTGARTPSTFRFPDNTTSLISPHPLIVGSGAFGKVYEGRWFPKESVSDDARQGYPVAIKILKDNSDHDSTREFFDVSGAAVFFVCSSQKIFPDYARNSGK